MTDKKFQLGDYVEVKDRIAQFYERYPDGRLVTEEVKVMDEPDGVPRIIVSALAYRGPDDPLPGRGHSWMTLPGGTPYTRGSELENTETSAWGRAIGALGIGIAGGIASAQEVQNKQEQSEPVQVGSEVVELLGRIQKTGKVMKGGSDQYKVEWRETPDGPVIGFRLKLLEKDGRDIPQVLINGGIAEALRIAQPELVDEKVTVKGHLYNVKGAGRTAFYRLIVGERPEDWIEVGDFRIPPAETEANPDGIRPTRDPEQEVVDAVPVAEGQESLPL